MPIFHNNQNYRLHMDRSATGPRRGLFDLIASQRIFRSLARVAESQLSVYDASGSCGRRLKQHQSQPFLGGSTTMTSRSSFSRKIPLSLPFRGTWQDFLRLPTKKFANISFFAFSLHQWLDFSDVEPEIHSGGKVPVCGGQMKKTSFGLWNM